MSDPKRLLHGAGGPFVMELLSVGRDELPSDAALQRTLERATLAAGAAATLAHAMLETAQAASHTSHAVIQGTGAMPAAASGSATTGAAAVGGAVQSAGAAAGATKVGLSVVALSKWVGIAAVGIGVSSATPAALRWLEREEVPLPAKAVVREGVASAPVEAVPTQTVPTQTVPTQTVPTQTVPTQTVPGAALAVGPARRSEPPEHPRALSVRSPLKAPARGARDELRLVDSARGALQSGDAARALDVLQHYEARIAEPQFELEVAVLRMEALQRLGRSGAAQRQARQLLTRSLPEPQAARARAILDGRASIE